MTGTPVTSLKGVREEECGNATDPGRAPKSLAAGLWDPSAPAGSECPDRLRLRGWRRAEGCRAATDHGGALPPRSAPRLPALGPGVRAALGAWSGGGPGPAWAGRRAP